MISLSLEGCKLLVASGTEPPRTFALPLNTLRKVFLFMPSKYRWHCAHTTARHNSANLDDLSDDELADLLAKLTKLRAERAEFDLLLEDYVGRCVILSLADIDASGIDILGELGRHRSERRQKVVDWTKHGPALIMTGALGDRATLGAEGVRGNAGPYMAWMELDRVEVEPDSAADHSAYRFVPKPGSASHEFSVRMPALKAMPFMAEYTFWHSRALRRAEAQAAGSA